MSVHLHISSLKITKWIYIKFDPGDHIKCYQLTLLLVQISQIQRSHLRASYKSLRHSGGRVRHSYHLIRPQRSRLLVELTNLFNALQIKLIQITADAGNVLCCCCREYSRLALVSLLGGIDIPSAHQRETG
jgi:hypothetical protein